MAVNGNAEMAAEQTDLLGNGLQIDVSRFFLKATPEGCFCSEQEDVRLNIVGGQDARQARQYLLEFVRFFEEGEPPTMVVYGQFGLGLFIASLHMFGVPCPRLYRTGDKWNGYLSRYGSQYALDLLDATTGFGFPLELSAARFGMPRQFHADEAQVELKETERMKNLLVKHLAVIGDIS